MNEDWAKQYSEDYGFYAKEKGRCENPHCGHYPIFYRHIVRDPRSGDAKEIGSYCYQRWLNALGRQTDPWFDDYLAALEFAGREAGRIRIRRGSSLDREAQERGKRKWLKRQKRKGLLVLLEQPLQNFPTLEAADKYAQTRGGYCEGTATKPLPKCGMRRCKRHAKYRVTTQSLGVLLMCKTHQGHHPTFPHEELEEEKVWELYVREE